MRFAPIPDDEVWCGGHRQVMLPPNDEALLAGTITPVETVIDNVVLAGGQFLAPRINLRVALDEGDIDQLKETGTFWISLLGPVMPPMAVSMEPVGNAR